MPSAQVRNQGMQQLGSVDHLYAYDRNFAATFYDSVGGMTVLLGDASKYVNFNAVKINPAPEIFSISGGVVTLLKAGMFLFNFQVMTQYSSGSGAASNRVWLEQDPATGAFATVVPAITYYVMPMVASGIGTGFVSIALRANGDNYRYRVGLRQDFGSITLRTVADGSYFSISTLLINE